jgi:xanthine dehydrogenase accessory factor
VQRCDRSAGHTEPSAVPFWLLGYGQMKRELFELVVNLARDGVSFVIATVVRRDGMSSAHQGDMAVVTADGAFHGWIGGGCTRPTVEREAALALVERRPRLICLSPTPQRDPRSGILALPMTCHSGGTVEVYLDPVIAAPRLVLFGRSPIITALAVLARAIGYRVDVADPATRPDEVPAADRVFTSINAPELAGHGAAIVVASMGDFDEEAVVAALALEPAYLGVVASRRRYALLRESLLARGIAATALEPIANPAGLDLGAREAGEVAVSILAQIVARKNAIPAVSEEPSAPAATKSPRLPEIAAAAPVATSIDPVCKMAVEIARAKYVGVWDERTWYFCCGGCKTKFLASPTKFVAEPAKGLAK